MQTSTGFCLTCLRLNLVVHIKTMWFITFSAKHPICKTSLRLNRCLIKTKTLQVNLSEFCDHSRLFLVEHLKNRTEHVHKKLTFLVPLIQSKEKQRNSVVFFFFFWFETRNINAPRNFFHSYLLLLKQQTWNIKENVSCASSGINLLSIFETLGQKMGVFLSIFCGTKITLEWIFVGVLSCFLSGFGIIVLTLLMMIIIKYVLILFWFICIFQYVFVNLFNNFFTCRYHFPFTASRLITLRIATIFKISNVWLHRCSSYVIAKSSTDKSFKLSIFAIFIVVHEVLIRCRCSKKVFWCQKFCDMVP